MVNRSVVWLEFTCKNWKGKVISQMVKEDSKRERLAVYIDGFNLYHGIHASYNRTNLWLDVVKLSRTLRPDQRLVSVKYFTATVLNDAGAQSRQDHYIAALKAMNPTVLEVIYGKYQQKVKKCHQCGHKYISYEEKETDVNLATALVVDAAKGIFDTALIVSGDSDIAPAVRAAQRLRSGTFMACAFPPKRSSSELRTLLPASFVIGAKKIRNAQLPDSFSKGGKSYARPDKWN